MLPNAQDPSESSNIHFHHLVPGPAVDADHLREGYEPVSCDFSDELEEISVKKLAVDVAYWDDSHHLTKASGRITDIYTSANKEEFLKLDDGTQVRLDMIMEVRTN